MRGNPMSMPRYPKVRKVVGTRERRQLVKLNLFTYNALISCGFPQWQWASSWLSQLLDRKPQGFGPKAWSPFYPSFRRIFCG